MTELKTNVVRYWTGIIDRLVIMHHGGKQIRVSEIQERTHVAQWRHVRSADNPADNASSRGMLPSQLVLSIKWK